MMTEAASPLPGVTVVIPSYNYASYLAEAVRSAQAQNYQGKLEILVVDDGSSDGTPEVIASFGPGIRSHHKRNAGLSAARNTGMELASHDLVVFLDADDLLEPYAVEALVRARLQESAQPAVVGSKGRMIDAAGAWLADPPPGCDGRVEALEVSDFVLRNRFAPIVLADRRILLELGGFDPALAASEDRDMWIRVAALAPIRMVHTVLHRKRDHGTNMSRHAERQTGSILQVLAKARQHPDIDLPRRVWSEAEAVCLFQSARMHLAAGDHKSAVMQCLRSICRAWWLTSARSAGYPGGFRFRFLMLECGRMLGLRRAAAHAKKSPPRVMNAV